MDSSNSFAGRNVQNSDVQITGDLNVDGTASLNTLSLNSLRSTSLQVNYINPTGGNIAINSTSTSTTLTIAGPPNDAINGPHINFLEYGNLTNPVAQFLNYDNNNIQYCMDCYFDTAANLRMSGPNNGYGIRKVVNQLRFDIAALGSAGSLSSFTNYLTLGSTGNIGIHTTAPSSTLQVLGSTNLANFSARQLLINNLLNPTTGSYLEIHNSNNTVRTLFGVDGQGITGTSGQIVIGSWSNHPFKLVTNATIRATLNTSGNFGIGTETPTTLLDVSGTARITGAASLQNNSNTVGSIFTTGGNVGIGTTAPTFQLQLSTDSAAKPSTNTWTISSDARLKENIETANLDICYDIVKNVPLRRYRWKDEVYSNEQVKDRSQLGFIADEVEKYFPKSVGKINAHGLDDCKSLNNDQMIFMLFGTVKRLMKMVEEGNNNPPEPFVPKPPAPEPEPEGDDEGSAEVSGPEPEPEEVVEEAPEQAPEEVVETRAIKKRGRPKKLI